MTAGNVECRSCDQLMTERDAAEEMADKLADDIAALTGVEIGEHSSSNFPWDNAHEAAELPARITELEEIADLASRLDVAIQAEDDMAMFELEPELTKVLRPWRERRARNA